MKRQVLLTWVLCLGGLVTSLSAQSGAGGRPLSFSPEFRRQFGADLPQAQTIGALNLQQIAAEDRRQPGSRFTSPLPVDYSPANSGEWTELENGSLWRLHIQAPGAEGMAFLYDQFYLPPGATLFMYSADGRQVLGAYTARNNTPGGKFLTGFIAGEGAVLEYFEPRRLAGKGRLHLFRIDRAYRRDFSTEGTEVETRSPDTLKIGFRASSTCNQNANCSIGDDWRRQQRSVCRILLVVEEGIGYCTGTLVNNLREDGAPLVLTGFHCQDTYTPLYDFWRFDFGYESPDCSTPDTEPAYRSILGCQRLAGRRDNDMLLLELSRPIPPSYGAYFAGWNRLTAPPPLSAVNIHHPVGDIKKISTIEGVIRVFNAPINWPQLGVQTPAGHHYTMNYSTGTYEVGSSGSALFDPDGLLVGTLHGGSPTCVQSQAYFARFALAWEGGGSPEQRLKDWLDPDGGGLSRLSGTENPLIGKTGNFSGRVITEEGKGVAQVTVALYEASDTATQTDASGQYSLAELPLGEVYALTLEKEGAAINGVTTLDLIRVRKHVLGIERLNSPYKMLAADVNNSGSITTLDLVQMSKVILGINKTFDPGPHWQFVPKDYPFSNPENPFEEEIPSVFSLTNFRQSLDGLDFIAIKKGDVNGSADPG